MTTRDRLPKARAYHLPPFAVIVEAKHAHQLLEMVVEHGVVHARVDVVKRLADDRVAGHDVQRDSRRCEECRRVHAQATKVADDETAKLVRLREREARDGVLRVCLERDAILQHRRQERGKEEAHETSYGSSQPPRPAAREKSSFIRTRAGAALSSRDNGGSVRYSLVEPPDAFVLRVQPKHPHDAGRDAVRSRMTVLDEARADYEPFPARLTAVLVTLAHDHTAMFRYFAVRLDVTHARQLACDGEQRSVKVQRRNDLRGEARAQVRARWRDRANGRCQLDADPKLEVRIRQYLW